MKRIEKKLELYKNSKNRSGENCRVEIMDIGKHFILPPYLSPILFTLQEKINKSQNREGKLIYSPMPNPWRIEREN